MYTSVCECVCVVCCVLCVVQVKQPLSACVRGSSAAGCTGVNIRLKRDIARDYMIYWKVAKFINNLFCCRDFYIEGILGKTLLNYVLLHHISLCKYTEDKRLLMEQIILKK